VNRSLFVLFVSPLPPPFGGIASLTEIINSKGLPVPYSHRVLDTKISRKKFSSLKFIRVLSYLKREIFIFLKFFYYILLRRPNIIHLNSSVSENGVYRDFLIAALAKCRNIPVLCHYHGSLADFNTKAPCSKLSTFAMKNLLNTTSINIFSNIPSLNASLNKYGQAGREGRGMILPNYASDDIWTFRHTPKERTKIEVIFVGNLITSKGIELIFQLSVKLKDFNFTLVGGNTSDSDELFKKYKGENVKVVGPLKRNEVYQYLEESDIFLFPSHTEGFPMAIVEAMAVGLPILSSNVGSLPEMVDFGDGGFFHNHEDIDGFEKSLLLLKSFDMRKKMSMYNFEKAFKNYKYESVIQRLTDVYSRFCR
jgi:glycosyltransferase involved in cell wall biosynthesis